MTSEFNSKLAMAMVTMRYAVVKNLNAFACNSLHLKLTRCHKSGKNVQFMGVEIDINHCALSSFPGQFMVRRFSFEFSAMTFCDSLLFLSKSEAPHMVIVFENFTQ